jgi:hypothetical protein
LAERLLERTVDLVELTEVGDEGRAVHHALRDLPLQRPRLGVCVEIRSLGLEPLHDRAVFVAHDPPKVVDPITQPQGGHAGGGHAIRDPDTDTVQAAFLDDIVEFITQS